MAEAGAELMEKADFFAIMAAFPKGVTVVTTSTRQVHRAD
jgi:hypothetical protein